MKTRREFLSESAVLAAGAVLWPLQAKASPSSPTVSFPANPRERIAVASYPFRDFILPAVDPSGADGKAGPKMELTEFASHVSSRFNINKIEPWSRHFRSLEAGYLEQFRSALDKAKAGVVNVAVDGEHSFYAVDASERERAIRDNTQWIDAAVALGSPSIRTHIASADNRPPDLERAADTLLRIVEYAAARNVVVHLENDDPITEDPFFLVKLIDKVNSPWLRGLPDFGNTLMSKAPADAYAGVEAMFKHAYGICHVKQSESTEGGANVQVDLAYVFAILKKSGYRGYCSMEYDNSGDPYRGTAELIEKTMQLLA